MIKLKDLMEIVGGRTNINIWRANYEEPKPMFEGVCDDYDRTQFKDGEYPKTWFESGKPYEDWYVWHISVLDDRDPHILHIFIDKIPNE